MANVFPLDIVAPGAFGLNTEAQNTLLRPQWATQALNAVVNRSGRLAARKGWADQTTTGISGDHNIKVMHEYLDEAGASVIVSTANNKIYKDIDDFSDAANDITSTTAPTADYWQFVNFNGKVLGFQAGHTPIERTSGDFTDASYTGTGPDGNCAVAAFGRVWAADADLQTVRYSVLLDDTDYSTGNGGGTIDMSSIWTQGMDKIVAITAIGSNLVVFGQNHIVMWGDKSGSEIGLDPTELEVLDTIEGTGCIARDSIAITGEGDLIFLSRHGVQSLGRVIEVKNNPTTTLSRHVRADMQEAISQQRGATDGFDAIQSTHSPEEGLYIINFPALDKQFVFDTQHAFQDDEGEIVFPITSWQLGGTISAMLTATTGDLYFGSNGVVGRYEGENDNAVAYDFEMKTGWIDFEDPQINHRLKMLKEVVASVQVGSADLLWNWEFDFNGTQLTRSITYTGGSTAEFNEGEFNIAEFSGGVIIQRKNIAAHGEGQFLRLGVSSSINGSALVVQHLSVSPKIGRMVT